MEKSSACGARSFFTLNTVSVSLAPYIRLTLPQARAWKRPMEKQLKALTDLNVHFAERPGRSPSGVIYGFKK